MVIENFHLFKYIFCDHFIYLCIDKIQSLAFHFKYHSANILIGCLILPTNIMICYLKHTYIIILHSCFKILYIRIMSNHWLWRESLLLLNTMRNSLCISMQIIFIYFLFCIDSLPYIKSPALVCRQISS